MVFVYKWLHSPTTTHKLLSSPKHTKTIQLTQIDRKRNQSDRNGSNIMKHLIILCVAAYVFAAAVEVASESRLDLSKLDLEHVDCNSKVDMIDECGLQQGFSRRFEEFGYPMNYTSLISSCKRQADAFKCLRAYSKCLPSLSKQVLVALVVSRQKFNKKICSTDKQSELASQLLGLSQCMHQSEIGRQKGLDAELNSIAVPEAIVNSKLPTVQERIKYSCCSVAQVRREFMDAIVPDCKQYSQIASEMIDSYLSDTVGIICPDLEAKTRDCDKLPKLSPSKQVQASFLVRPIVNVVQSLSMS